MATGIKEKSSSTAAKAVKHSCIQKVKIADFDRKLYEIHEIITGNNTPEKGMKFQLAILSKGQSDVLGSLNEVSSGIRGLQDKYLEAIGMASSAKNAVETYKKEMDAYDAGKHSEKDNKKEHSEADRISKEQKHARIIRILNAISIFIGAISVIILVINSFRNVKETKATQVQVKDLGEPVITNSRGQILNIPDLHIKYYPNDFMGEDTDSVNNNDTQDIKK